MLLRMLLCNVGPEMSLLNLSMLRAEMYNLIDSQTKRIVGTYKSVGRAYAAADRKDSEYGAVRYIVEPVKG